MSDIDGERLDQAWREKLKIINERFGNVMRALDKFGAGPEFAVRFRSFSSYVRNKEFECAKLAEIQYEDEP